MNTLEELIAEHDEMLDEKDIPLSWTPRMLAAHQEKRGSLRRRINWAKQSLRTLAAVEPEIAPLAAWRDFLVSARATLCQQMLALPKGDKRMRGFQLSIVRIDKNLDFNEMLPARIPLDALMATAGYVPTDDVARAKGDAWFGSLPEVEQRLKALIHRRDEAQRYLEMALRDPVPRTSHASGKNPGYNPDGTLAPSRVAVEEETEV